MNAQALPPSRSRCTTRPPTGRLALAGLLCALAAGAQANEASCISAGRLNAEGRWAPRFEEVRLLDEAGRALSVRNKSELARVRAVDVSQPALLSTCDGERGLARGEGTAAAKAPVPAASAGRYPVEGVGFAKLQTGGELVELKVRVPADRVVMITR